MTGLQGAITLRAVGSETKRLFRQVITKINESPKNEGSPKEQFAAEADRFGLWVVNMGLFVSGHGSLDYRVREAENIQNMILTFLKTLNDSLNEALQYYSSDEDESEVDSTATASDGELSDDGWKEDSDEEMDSDIELLLDSVRDPIDRLYRLATLIRNPSSRFASSKLQGHKQIDSDTGVDFLKVVHNFETDYIRSIFLQYKQSKSRAEDQEECLIDDNGEVVENVAPPTDESRPSNSNESFLIQRLALANVRRRQQFSYWRKHREKLDLHSSSFEDQSSKPRDVNVRALAPERGALRIHSDSFKQTQSNLFHQSVTTATHLHIHHDTAIKDSISTVSVSKYAVSNWRPGNENLEFPSAPRVAENQKFFECPYCYTLCPKAVLGEEAWK
ncbi:hypothetical protein TWF694_006628 [Orbilia ellipsospora]|uniref:Uncharacterized protein n=1 Tax=Orbilia ellipsospora TaxID=2528407 RepID=A0AAV9XN97_9PEZI